MLCFIFIVCSFVSLKKLGENEDTAKQSNGVVCSAWTHTVSNVHGPKGSILISFWMARPVARTRALSVARTRASFLIQKN